jgi:predicted ABC-type ATPase
MFAGPNGSGKSTLKSVLPVELLGVYLNPDDIESTIRTSGLLRLSDYSVSATEDEALAFLAKAPVLISSDATELISRLQLIDGVLQVPTAAMTAYFASAVVEFLRIKLLASKTSFTFETVMSHASKVALLQSAQQSGYRTYLYYIATDDPAINVSRVRNRVKLGGHAVPEARIVARYYRSLDLLMDAIRNTNRAYVFDNSGDNQSHTWLAEITDGKTLETKTNLVPAWFKRFVLDKISRLH